MELEPVNTNQNVEGYERSEVSGAGGERKAPLRIAITGASGHVAYSLAFMIGQGKMFGDYQPIILHLISRPSSISAVEGLKFELEDWGLPLLEDIVVWDSLEKGFNNIDIALLVGGRPRSPGMERKDLIQKNAEIFRDEGIALDKYANPHVKVCVVGNPCNTMALVCARNAPSIPLENFTAISRLDQNRASCQLAKKIGVNSKNIHNVMIWGNHSSTMFPYLENAWVADFPVVGRSTKVSAAVDDETWISNDFLPIVQKRGGAIITTRGVGAAASTANAICDHMKDWILGTKDDEAVSMCVISNNNPYGVKDGLMFSFPVTCKNGEWKIVDDLNLNEDAQQMLRKNEAELIDERIVAFELDAKDQDKKIIRIESVSTDESSPGISN